MQIGAKSGRQIRAIFEFCGKARSGFKSRDLAKRIAFVPQETHMVFPFTAGEIVMSEALGPIAVLPRDGLLVEIRTVAAMP